MSATGDLCLQVGGSFTVRLEHIVLPSNVPAGLSPWLLFAIANDRRNGGHQVRDPIVVSKHPDWPDGWQIHDGRHRYVASVMAGAVDILCVEGS